MWGMKGKRTRRDRIREDKCGRVMGRGHGRMK